MPVNKTLDDMDDVLNDEHSFIQETWLSVSYMSGPAVPAGED